MGALTARRGDAESGRRQLEEAVELWRELGDRDELASALDSLGWPLIYDAGDETSALAAFEEALEIRRELGDAAARLVRSSASASARRARRSRASRDDLTRTAREGRGDPARSLHHFLADCALIRGDTVEAETRYRESLAQRFHSGMIETSFEVQGVAMAVAGSGAAEWVATGCLGRGPARVARHRDFHPVLGRAPRARYLGPAREQLGAEADLPWTRVARSSSTKQSRSPSVRKIAG